jgi:hypothetical protein
MALAWAPSVPALIGPQQCAQRHVKSKGNRACRLAAVAGGLAEMFAVCGNRRDPHGPSNCDLLTAPGILARRADAKLVLRPVDMVERIHAPFRRPLPVWLMWFQAHHTFCITIPELILGLLRYTDTLGFPTLSQTTLPGGHPCLCLK